ncbi:MAG: SDR family oxidoreductase [candidate division WS1 bacterium]|jgi:NAD(P)-dependent dehydrogenase (short-subunit alcohol dehydrogenase family)|nr:SDR family oxidoreductase [candidate division WS1 bacterium]
MYLKDKVALITGAGAGIGASGAELFSREGARVCLVDIDRDELDEQVAKIRDSGGEAIGIVADMREPAQVGDAVTSAISQWNSLDIAWANAGINGVRAPVEEITPEEWDEVLATNLRGTFLTAKYAAPHLKERNGVLLITSSINGTRKFTGIGGSPYAASKAGQVAFGKMLAVELAQKGVRVNVICPGAVETEIGESTRERNTEEIELGIEYTEGIMPLVEEDTLHSEHVARAALFLASDQAEGITGTVLYVDGAESLIQ